MSDKNQPTVEQLQEQNAKLQEQVNQLVALSNELVQAHAQETAERFMADAQRRAQERLQQEGNNNGAQ